MTDQTANPDLKDLQNEFSTLDRVSHRLAMTDPGAPLQKVLSLLLPRLLSRIGKNDDAKRENRRGVNKRKLSNVENGAQEKLDEMYETIHKKLTEMLMHIMKRVRNDRECKLPCESILELLAGKDVNAFTVNLSLAFLTLGVNRCSPVECSGLLPGLMEFLGSLLIGIDAQDNGSCVGVDYLTDPSRKMRCDQTYHLILRCFEKVSHNPLENAAARRASSTASSQSIDGASISVSSLAKTKDLMLSRPIIAAAVFDLFLDVFLYTSVPANSSLIPNGMSAHGYQCLSGGAASENSGFKSWKEEFGTRAKLKELKLKFLDLIAPCRRFALFLRDENTAEAMTTDTNATTYNLVALGISRTVALMVLLSGDVDLDVKSKAESYLKAHMDTHRGKEVLNSYSGQDKYDQSKDPLLGNQVVLADSLLAYVMGGLSSDKVTKKVLSNYDSKAALTVADSRLGLVHHLSDHNDTHQQAMLSCHRMKLADTSVVPVLKFLSKMLEDSPKLFHVMDMANDNADIAAVCIGSLVLSIFGDMWKPGSSGSPAVESAASLLNALCLRLAMFYETREHDSSARLQTLLAKSMSLACLVLSPTSSGESAPNANGTRVATTQIEIRDKVYGVVCTLARSNKFSLNEMYSLFDCGSETNTDTFTSISTAKLLFGCAANETDTLRPRATSGLDALLSAYVRVVRLQKEKKSPEPKVFHTPVRNPWTTSAQQHVQSNSKSEPNKTKGFSADSLSRSLLPLLWSAGRRSQTKSSRLSAARWAQELILLIDNVGAYHLLCFLAGDDDPSVSMVSKKALSIESTLGQDISMASLNHEDTKASFAELVAAVMCKEKSSSMPTFDRFHVRAQAASLRFLLQLLLGEDNFYGDERLAEYVSVILDSLALHKNRSLTRDETDLLDECSICLAGCTSSSQEARRVVINHGFEDIADQAVKSSSSKARVSLNYKFCSVSNHVAFISDALSSVRALEAFF